MAAAGDDPAPFDLSVEAGWRFAKDAIDEALLDHTGSKDDPPLADTTPTMDEMDLLSRARRLAVMRRILLDIARGPSESSTGPKRTERVSEISNRLSRYRVGMSILHAHASKRLKGAPPPQPKENKSQSKKTRNMPPKKEDYSLKNQVGWSVDVSLSDVIHAFMHEHIPTSGWPKNVTADLDKARRIASGSPKLRKPAQKRLAEEICRQASMLQQCLGGMHHALKTMEEEHSNHVLVSQISDFFETHGVATEPCSRSALESLLGDYARALRPSLVHISTHGVHKAANGLGLSEDASVRLGWSSVITSTFEQALDTLLDKGDAWVVNRLPCHGLVFARGRNSAADIQSTFIKHARKALHNTITTAMKDEPASITDQKVRNQISQLVSNVMRIDVVKQSPWSAQPGFEIQPLGPLDLEAMETMLTKIAEATKTQLSNDREAWVSLSQYPIEHEEDNEAQGLHDVYFDVIGLSKVVWGKTGTKHLVTKGGSRGQRVLSGPQGEVHEQFRIGGLAGASIDMSLITFLLVFQRSEEVQSEEEGPQSIGGDEANLVIRASESGLGKLADKAEAMLSALLDCDHAPLNRRLGWKVREGRGQGKEVSIECELAREHDKPRPALGAPMWWMRNTPYHTSSKDVEAHAPTDQFVSVKEAKNRNRLSLEDAPNGGIFLRMDNDAPPLM